MTLHRWVFALVVWTVFVWGNRVVNVLGDDALSNDARTWRLAVAAGFVGVAVVVGVGTAFGRRTALRLGGALAAVGIVWWTIRGVQTLVGDWSVAFKTVHTALALVTIALGVMVIRAGGYDASRYG